MSEAKINDKKFIESLRGDTNSMGFLVRSNRTSLISRSLMVILQNTLFSAIVASFILETYGLSDDSGQQAADGPSSMVVRVNIVLFLSFFLSMMSAVGCALIQ
jgi:hypothetical protein